MHEFGWAADDYDRLGAGSLVGHILECGPQATGGTFTDWDTGAELPDRGCSGRRRHGVPAHRSAGQGLRADGAGNDHPSPKILGRRNPGLTADEVG
jgi:hypothetical protein